MLFMKADFYFKILAFILTGKWIGIRIGNRYSVVDLKSTDL